MSIRKFTAALAAFSLTVGASASISIQLQAGGFYMSDGMTPISVGSAGILVADTGNDGFTADLAGDMLNTGNFLDDDDKILGTFSAQDLGAFVGFNGLLSNIPYTDLTVDDDLMFYWFPDTSVGGSVTVGSTYGTYRSDVTNPSAGSTISFNVPPDGNTETLNFYTSDASGGAGNANDADFTADEIVVPEPSTYAVIAGALALGLAFWRRRR